MRGGNGAAKGPECSGRSKETGEEEAPSVEGEARPEAGGTARAWGAVL